MPTHTPRKVVVGLGEVLWDLLPQGKQLGGAPANFAYHAHALGAEAWPVTRIGQDPLGQEILERFRALKLPPDFVTIDPIAPTGTVSVVLSPDGQPRFTIHENVAWDQLVVIHGARELLARADAVCFGTLAQRNEKARASIHSLVSATRPDALRIFDINLRQHFYSREIIQSSLGLANVLKINDQELPVLANMFGLRGEVPEQVTQLAQRYNLSLVALTRGAHGSLLFSEGSFSEHPGVTVKMADAIGAGDAFTAAMALGRLASWSLIEINRRANEVAAYVCSQSGATPPLPQQLKDAFASGR